MDIGTNKMQLIQCVFHDALTGETITRELTAEEMSELYPNGFTEALLETPEP
jgi:hypothetical protein